MCDAIVKLGTYCNLFSSGAQLALLHAHLVVKPLYLSFEKKNKQKKQTKLCRYDPILECVITFTDELAEQQARTADALLAGGTYLGPLHGIPYGLKDLMAVPGYLTTWGAASFKNQYLSQPAHVYTK